MIVTRLVLHTRNIRASMGIAGIGGLCKAIITMLVESSVIYAMSSFLGLGLLGAGAFISSGFLFILAETQARALLRPQLLDRLSNMTADSTGHRSTPDHSASRQQDCADEQHYRLWTCQYNRSKDPRGISRQ